MLFPRPHTNPSPANRPTKKPAKTALSPLPPESPSENRTVAPFAPGAQLSTFSKGGVPSPALPPRRSISLPATKTKNLILLSNYIIPLSFLKVNDSESIGRPAPLSPPANPSPFPLHFAFLQKHAKNRCIFAKNLLHCGYPGGIEKSVPLIPGGLCSRPWRSVL